MEEAVGMPEHTEAYTLEDELKSPADLRSCGRHFSRHSSVEGREDALQAPLVWEFWLLHEMEMEAEAARGRLKPAIEGDQNQSPYPPPVEELPNRSIEYFRQRAGETRHPSLRSRYLEFLWQRTGDFDYAREAIQAYREALEEGMEVEADRADLSRLAQWGFGLADSVDEETERMAQTAVRLIEHLSGDPGGFFFATVEAATPLLVSNRRGVVEDTLSRLEGLAEEDPHTMLATRAAEVGENLASQAGRNEKAARFRALIPHTLEARADWMADEGNGGNEAFLQQALVRYRDLGDPEAVERVKRKLHEAGEASAESLQVFSTEETIERDRLVSETEELLRRGRTISEFAHLQIFALNTYWPAWEDVEQKAQELAEDQPLSMFSNMLSITQLGPDARPRVSPDDREERRELQALRKYIFDLQITLPIAELRVEVFQELGAWTEELILDALASGVLFEEPDLDAVRPGLQAFEEQRTWEAAHVLFPRIEAAVRRLAKKRGVDVYALGRESEELELKTLGKLLSEPRVRTVLNSLRPDFSRELRYVLMHNWGLNLRNQLAHGIRRPEQVASWVPLLFLIVLLALSVVPEEGLSGVDGSATASGEEAGT